MISFDGAIYCALLYERTSHGRVFCTELRPGQLIKALNFTTIINEPKSAVNPITIVGHELYLLTGKNTPNKHIVAVDINNPNEVSNKALFNLI